MTSPPRGRTSGAAAANESGKITREVALAAALEIIDADGLSMRPRPCAGPGPDDPLPARLY
jgi:hypothetical protein